MELIDYSYEGFYARFDALSQKEGALLAGKDNLVGDDYEIVIKTDGGTNTAWAKNRFGVEVGYFDADTSRRLALARGRGQNIRAVLALVAFTETLEPSHYWGQMALFCYNPAYAAEMDAFVDRCAAKLADGVRPKIDLGSQGVEKIFKETDWVPEETTPLPNKEKGTAVVKDHLTVSEKVVEQGRAGNKGCYAISWAIYAVLAVAVVYFIAHLIGVV